MNDEMNSTNKQPSDGDKKAWKSPEITDYDYGSLTQGGANPMGVDDVSGDNYAVS
jgi:hypothetical protein